MSKALVQQFVAREGLSQYLLDGRVLAMLAAAGFSMKAIFVKLSYAAYPVDPITLLALRMVLALPLFLLLAWRERGAGPLGRQDIWLLLLIGFLGYYLSSLTDFIGLFYISAGLERLILFTYPTLVLLFGAVLLKQPIPAKAWPPMLVCYIGIFAAVGHDLQQRADGHTVLIGAAWVFASAVSYALYYLGVGKLAKRIGSTRMAGWAGAASSGMVLAHFAAVGDFTVLPKLPGIIWGYSAAMAVFSTVLPIALLAAAIRRLGAGVAAGYATLGPVLTIVFAWLLLGESFTWMQALGLGLVMGGVSWLARSK
ncbi:DMT family transporter [Parachitinimonas caeni]|uniref:DMT family transporter n=1 Tax=Parachitinimonas caeni TaxID=3031301 RepID=A0ABT7DZX6_9NEIS|nr:DMT family transporter [Parachitinimonas caeni]MDK2124197.1 DMT family transporter [Parachitinimonas caeni]